MAEYTFILTGADCSGKSAAVKELTERLAKDFFVLVVPEAATLIIEKGINSPDPVLFQKQVLCQQLASESSVDAGANGGKDTVVLLDRCVTDGYGFLEKEQFDSLLEEAGVDAAGYLKKADAVIQLQSDVELLKSKPDSNNPYRLDRGLTQVLRQEKRLKEIYLALCPEKYHFIEICGRFEEKAEKCYKIITDVIRAKG